MIIIPAIDILNGEAVRLYRGLYSKKEKVAESILETALSFEEAGAEFIHLVDLNGAKTGEGVNYKKIIEIAKTTNIPIEVGGGVRTIEIISNLLESGVSRVILGTAAVKDKSFLREAISEFKENIAIGVDYDNGLICTDGWVKKSSLKCIDYCKYLEDIGAKNIIVTDISKDGTLEGPNLDMLREIKGNVSMNITASGGVKDLKDIETLIGIDVYGTIVGKAIYEGTLNLKSAISLAKSYY